MGTTINRVAAIQFLLLLFCCGAEADEWRTQSARRFGVSAQIPSSWLMEEPPVNNDGRRFTSPDKTASIVISGRFAILSYQEEIADATKSVEGRTVTYIAKGNRWIVTSGVEGDKIYYRKSMLVCRDTIWNNLWIEYLAVEKDRYDSLVRRVSKSLRTVPSDECSFVSTEKKQPHLGKCEGILHLNSGELTFGGGAGEGEGVCVINADEQERVLATCSPAKYCKVQGAVELCKDSGECVEISDIISVSRR